MNVNEKVPSVSMVFDRNLPAATTVCGMSSRLVQVTVVPTFTVSCAGSKVKLSIITLVLSSTLAVSTLASSARAKLTCRSMATAMVMPRLRRVADIIVVVSFGLWFSALQRGVDDGERLVVLLEVDAGDAQQA